MEKMIEEIVAVFVKHNQTQLIDQFKDFLEDLLDEDYMDETNKIKEPVEEYNEFGCVPENLDYTVDNDGFYELLS
jgi:hypothetical protein